MFNRRNFLLGASSTFAFSSLVPRTGSCADVNCIFGAIRWDAQYCDIEGQTCFEEEKILGASRWQFRAPLHSRIVGPSEIKFVPTQSTFDAEITAASDGGLKYWAYLMYGKKAAIDLTHPMMRGLEYHRSSVIRDKINYTTILTLDTIGRSGDFQESIQKVTELFRDENYQKVINGRPLVYLYYLDRLLKSYWNDSLLNLSEAVKYLRSEAKRLNLEDPYLVLLKGPPEDAERVRSAIAADAISAYAVTFPTDRNEMYTELMAYVNQYWQQETAATSAGVVPTIMVGWDQRPRKEYAQGKDQGTGSARNIDTHITPPTPQDFAEACKSAITFINAHPNACVSRLALIYAWNEDSEGGPLQPTVGDPAGRLLEAANKVIR